MVFRNNFVRNGRRVGVLTKGHRALIENNTFIGLGGGAVEYWDAPYEGLCATSFIVQDNYIEDTSQLDRTGGTAIYIETFGLGLLHVVRLQILALDFVS